MFGMVFHRGSLIVTIVKIMVIAVCVGFIGCASNQGMRSTRLTANDFVVTEDKITADLHASDFLNQRTSESRPMVIVVQKVENLTSDIMTEAEQWMAVRRVIDSLPIQELRSTKNIRLVIPRERHNQLHAREYARLPDVDAELKPTHLMTARFQSAVRAARAVKSEHSLTDARSEYYYFAYTITDLVGREIGWASSFEFSREGRGLLID